MKYVFILFLSFVLTSFLLPNLIKFLVIKKLVDNPGPRKIHASAVPRLGGVSIVFSMLFVMSIFVPEYVKAMPLLISAMILFFTGMIDDLLDINWKIKLLSQLISVLISLKFILDLTPAIYLFGIQLPLVIGSPLLILFMIGTINSINLMDGLDGLVSGFCILVFFVLSILGFLFQSQIITFLTIAIIGSLLSFLKYNSNPARIFLGDNGSLFLGYSLVISSFYISILRYGHLDLGFPILLLFLPIIDTLKVMFVRIRQGKNPFLPDKNHLHHIIFGKNIRHKIVVALIHLFSVGYIFMAVIYLKYNDGYLIIPVLLLSFILINMQYILNHVTLSGERRALIKKIISNKMKYIISIDKILIALSSLPLLGLIISIFSLEHYHDSNFPWIQIIVIMFLEFAIIAYHFWSSKKLDNIYILINSILFFSFATDEYYFQNIFHSISLLSISFVLLLIIVTFSIFIHCNNINDKISFFSGYDLIVIILFALLMSMQTVLPSTFLANMLGVGVVSITTYYWFRLIQNIFVEKSSFIPFLSYTLPVLHLLMKMNY